MISNELKGSKPDGTSSHIASEENPDSEEDPLNAEIRPVKKPKDTKKGRTLTTAPTRNKRVLRRTTKQ